MPFRCLLVLIVGASMLGFQLSVEAVQSSTRKPEGHVPAAVIGQQPKGRLAAEQRISLAVGLPLRAPQELSAFLRDLYDPSSPSFHQFLTPDQFTDRFGPTEEDYQIVKNFFQTNGFKISATHPNRLVLDVSGSVADIEGTFGVSMNIYQHAREARMFYSPDKELTLDARLPILHIHGLDNFVVPRPASRIESPDRLAKPLTGTGPGGSYMGTDFRTAYAPGIPVSYNGAGQFVGLVQFDGYNVNDILAYESLAGLPNVPLINVLLDDIPGTAGQDNIEVCLDIEMCVSIAPGLSGIIVYEGQAPNDVLNRMATDNVAKQLSASWTFGIDGTTEQIFQEFAAQGQSYFNASGDNDAYAGVVSTPSDDPFVTSVGGTILTTGGGAVYSSERSWNRNNGIGTGGGISTVYPIPSWQQGLDMSVNQGSTTMRNIPDVAMVAESVLVIYTSGTQKQASVGGTSVASPLWGAFMALVNQQGTVRGRPPVGFLNPAIYVLGQSTNYATSLHDIQTGNNTNSSSPTLFFAVPGYDLCTGWGSPKGTNLIEALVPRFANPLVTNISATLVLESCGPTNGVVDSGETVTVNFTLQNVGGADTTNLIVTLLSSGGVLAPAAPQNVGALPSGTAVTLPFAFTAGTTCGSMVTASLQLQDGALNLGTLVSTFPVGTPIKPLAQDFDSVSAPALPSGWTSTITGAASNWVTSTAKKFTGPNAAFIAEPANAGVAELTSPSVAVTTSTATLSFKNFYNSECDPAVPTNAYDGGVLEIKIGTAAFTDILTAGGSFGSGGYNKKIDLTDDNPLDGRRCWSGLSGDFITTVVNLPASAAGKTVQFKWRFGTDSGNAFGTGGWSIDAVALQDGSTCCALTSPPAIVTQPTSQTTFPGSNVTFSVIALGSAPLAYQWKFSGTNLPGATNSALVLTNVQLSQAGLYFVAITNAAGSTNSANTLLRLLVSPGLSLGRANVTSTNVSLSVTSVAGLNYTLQYKNALTNSNWTTILPTILGNGGAIILEDPNPPVQPARFYRVNVN